MSKTLKIISALSILAAISLAGYLEYRNRQMDRLYLEAAGYPHLFRGTTESKEAVRNLATYRGRRATGNLGTDGTFPHASPFHAGTLDFY